MTRIAERAAEFLHELAALCQLHQACMGYTTRDDGIHFSIDEGVEIAVILSLDSRDLVQQLLKAEADWRRR